MVVRAVHVLAALAWIVTVDQANGMGIGPGTMGLTFLAFLTLWVVMMAAMMLPSVAPMVVGVDALGVCSLDGLGARQSV